jgi:uncharacterized protein (TIGR02246 family)
MKKVLEIQWFVIALMCAATALAQSDEDRTKIESSVKSYIAAFNSGDAKALAAHWSPDGVYISRQTGERTSGRDALEKEFTAAFKQSKNAKLAATTDSIEFVSPNVALEQGTAVISRPDAKPEQTSYRVVHVKRDGKWLIDRITEEDQQKQAPSHHEQLKALDWMVGTWIDKEGGHAVKTDCKWSRNKNYLVRTFTASVEGNVNLTGMQFVGWDASRKQIRSWVFDSDGGFAQGVWTNKAGRWFIMTRATLPTGKLASSTSVLRPTGKDSFSWQKVNRVVDGEILPDIDRVEIVRQPQAKIAAK